MLSEIDRREQRVRTARSRARQALFIDMLKSYAGPTLIAGFVAPLLSPNARLGIANYGLVVAGLVMIGLALMFVAPKE